MEGNIFNLANYDYKIPPDLIAQEPVFPRDKSRLLIIDRGKNSVQEGVFKDIVGFLRQGDVLVLNDTKVLPARLIAKKEGGGKVEILLLKKKQPYIWEVLVKPGKRVRVGDTLVFDGSSVKAGVLDKTLAGGRVLQFFSPDFKSFLNFLGKPPLPPYIKKEIDDASKYQTVYAQKEGAIAAPTAGLHFTDELIKDLKNKGVEIVYVTLHCGLATFRPIKTEDIRQHNIESEWIEVNDEVEKAVNKAKKERRRVIAVGTTSIRTLESRGVLQYAPTRLGNERIPYIKSFTGETNLYIYPGYKFKIVDSVVTNFHTPHSTNLVLISSFCGKDLLHKAYNYAIKEKFRFYSFGDATIIV
jgi:S-adenosylmethionine:tRNA ribosyltransferase-isomerase